MRIFLFNAFVIINSPFKKSKNGGKISMKKLVRSALSVILAAGILAGLSACSEPVTLASKTVDGITLDVPSDFGEFTAQSDVVKIAANSDSTATISVSAVADGQGITADLWDQASFQEQLLSKFTDVNFVSFSNTEELSGVSAVTAHYTAKNSSGVSVESYSYLLYFEDGTVQSFSFNFNTEKETSLKTNIDAIIASLSIG